MHYNDLGPIYIPTQDSNLEPLVTSYRGLRTGTSPNLLHVCIFNTHIEFNHNTLENIYT